MGINVYWSVAGAWGSVKDDDILVPLKKKDGAYTLKDIILSLEDQPPNDTLWQLYFEQYNSEGDHYLNQGDFFEDLGIGLGGEAVTPGLIQTYIDDSIKFFRGTGSGQTLFDENGKIRREYFKLNMNDRTLETEFPIGHLNHSFWIKSLRFDYHWKRAAGVDRQTTGTKTQQFTIAQDSYFSIMEKNLKNKSYKIRIHTLISYLFATNPSVIEALIADTTEFLRDSGTASWGSSREAEIEWLKGDTREAKEALKKIRDKKAELDSDAVDEAGFGTKRLWSEQCLLNSNFHELAKFHKGEFYNYYRVAPALIFPKKAKTFFIESSQPSSIINQLTTLPGSRTFLNMKNEKYSNLLPQIQLFAINYSRNKDKNKTVNRSDPKLEKIIFPQNAQVFSGKSIMGRGDYGIKSFSWDLIGSNPRTQRNDIQAELSIYFQSLDQIFAKDANNNLLKLLKRPPSKLKKETKKELNKKSSQASSKASSRKDAIPEYYELKADVGWRQANNSTGLTQAEKAAINNQRLSLYLTLIDHTFSFNQDGTFLLNLTFRGRVEELMSKNEADALSTPKFKIERQIIKSIRSYLSEESTGTETSKKKSETFDKLVERHTRDFQRNAFSNIIDDMSNRNCIFYSRVLTSDFADFINKDKPIPLSPLTNFYTMNDICGEDTPGRGLNIDSDKFKQMLNNQSKIGEEEQDDAEEKSKTISASKDSEFQLGDHSYFFSFFFLGDLLETLFERATKFESIQSTIDEYLGTAQKIGKASRFLSDDSVELIRDEIAEKIEKNNLYYDQMKNTRLVLGSLPYVTDSYGEYAAFGINYNIAQIPISTKLFKDWFANKVVDRDVDVYPFTQFSRDIIKELAIYSLRGRCGNSEKANKNIVLKTTTLTGHQPIEKAANFIVSDPTPDLKGTHAENYVIINPNTTKPINFNQSGAEEEKSHSVIMIYAENSQLRSLAGDINKDHESGIQHLSYGRDRGIVKQIQFSKNDVPGLREAKFSRDSLNPLSELSTIYNASVTTVGNVIFWPGQKVFIDPLGMGSTIGRPTDPEAPAAVLGLGGYYTLADVRSTVDASSFTTTMRAIFETSGNKGSKHSLAPLTTNLQPGVDPDILELEEEDK